MGICQFAYRLLCLVGGKGGKGSGMRGLRWVLMGVDGQMAWGELSLSWRCASKTHTRTTTKRIKARRMYVDVSIVGLNYAV